MAIIAILLCYFILYSLYSIRLEGTIFTGPMIFINARIMLYFVFLDQFGLPLEVKPALRLMEITLAIFRALDASTKISIQDLIRSSKNGTRPIVNFEVLCFIL